MVKILCAVFVIVGTYLLSRKVFEHEFKKQINFTFDEMPFYLKIALIVFVGKGKFENKELWAPVYAPLPENFTLRQKFEIVTPFIGFVLISIGTIGMPFF